MELSDIPADRIVRSARGRARLLRLVVLVALACAGACTFAAHGALADPLIQLTVSPSSVPAGGTVTMTATVTSSIGTPTGWVNFVNAASPDIPLGRIDLSPAGARTQTVQFVTSSLQAMSTPYAIYATYNPDFTASLIGLTPAQSASQSLIVGNNVTPRRATQVTLTNTPSSITVDSTQPVTLTATVSEVLGGGIPGGVVDFTDTFSGSTIPLGSQTVDSAGVATLVVSTLAAGPHQIVASYGGNAVYAPSSSPPLLLNAHAPVDARLNTTTVVVVEPSPIAARDTVTITATIVQVSPTGPTPPAGGRVTFLSDKIGGTQVNIGAADLGTAPPGFPTPQPNQAVIQVAGWEAGEYTIIASYFGDIFAHDSEGEVPLSVLPARSVPTIAYTGDTTVAVGHYATVSATVTNQANVPLAGRTVTFTVGTQSCTATTDASGAASCLIYVTQAPTTTTVLAVVARDLRTDAASTGAPFTITSGPADQSTTLTYTGASTGIYHGAATLSATLKDAVGSSLPNRTVSFTLGSQSCTATTSPVGIASCTVSSLTQDPGAYTVVVTYAGDATTRPSATNAAFGITPAPTTLTASALTPAGATITLSATLSETASGAPLAGRTVTLSLGSAASTCTAITSPAGVATCAVPTPNVSSATLTASFAGDLDYAASSDTKLVTLVRPALATYTGSTSAEYHDVVIASGSLTDAQGTPLAGQPVTLTIGTQSCAATTSSTGKASCPLLLTQPAGTTTATLSYAGNATYGPATGSAPFTIAREETALVAKVSGAVINGSSISLSAVLLEDSIFPVAGRPVTLSLGTASCTATTNALGTATCTVPRAPTLGASTFTATFAGDAYYLPSTVTRSTIVCAFPAGGSFVIGDRDNGEVTFWGAQWSKKNHPSHGDAPAAFKGWTPGTFDSSWDEDNDWVSDTGSSGTQPPGPLPAYMAVIQTGSTRKSGSKIYGDTVHVVVVRTNAGYAPNAGHDGTGTVVATVS